LCPPTLTGDGVIIQPLRSLLRGLLAALKVSVFPMLSRELIFRWFGQPGVVLSLRPCVWLVLFGVQTSPATLGTKPVTVTPTRPSDALTFAFNLSRWNGLIEACRVVLAGRRSRRGCAEKEATTHRIPRGPSWKVKLRSALKLSSLDRLQNNQQWQQNTSVAEGAPSLKGWFLLPVSRLLPQLEAPHT
jgi:hypothetical protein